MRVSLSELTADKCNGIKAIQTIKIALPSTSGQTSTIIACTVLSDGNVNLYDIAGIPDQPSMDTLQKTKQIEPLTTYDSKGTRLTCVTLADGDMDIQVDGTVNGKRTRENDEDGSGNGDEDEHEHEHRHENEQEELDSGSDKQEMEDEAEDVEEDQSDSN